MKLNYIATITAASILTIGGTALFSDVATASTFDNMSTVVAGNPCASANPCAGAEENPCASANPCAGK